MADDITDSEKVRENEHSGSDMETRSWRGK